MKSRNLLAMSVFGILLACSGDEKEKTVERVDEIPTDIVASKLCETLYTNIMSMFPEAKNNEERHEGLFNDTTQVHIVLTKDSEVYVSFVAEGATITNTLGYYIYPDGATPGGSGDINKELVFPNVSNSVLQPGDTRQLGSTTFKAGTVIGFYLIVGGWNGSNGTVNYKKPTHYTNFEWNANAQRQHVLFKEKQCGDIVIGFEDKAILETDGDFNDIIFTVSDNNLNLETVSFDLKHVAVLQAGN
jgi:hypothetical protein